MCSLVIAQRQGVDALGDQLLGGVFGEVGVAVVGETGAKKMDAYLCARLRPVR